MKKITLSKILFILVCIPSFLLAQEKNSRANTKCLTDIYNAELIATNPNMMGSETFKQQLQSKIQEMQNTPQRRVVISIPLVVHVLHNGEPVGTGPNISDAQVLSQVTVMNEDFRMMMGTPGESTEGGVDVEVEFVMAQRTPDGCPTNGINRVNICQDGTNQSDVQFWKTQTSWDPSKYMNMWSSKYVGDLAGILGYAQFPGGPGNTDGVSAGHTFFGSSDYDDGSFELSPPYDKGRTMTHEVGHYLGLYHTFQGGCTAPGDEVDDTPAVQSPNFGCPPNNITCGSRDMVENYMDYSDDTCMNTFTQGQKDRVQAVLATFANRSTLAASDGADPLPGVSDDGAIQVAAVNPSTCGPEFTPSVTITNYGTSTMTSATISYDVDGGSSTDYNWSGSLAAGASVDVDLPTIASTAGDHTLNVSISNPGNARTCNDDASACVTLNPAPSMVSTTQVHLELTTDNYCEETTWEFRDVDGNVLYNGGPYAQNAEDNTTFNYDFDVTPGECYSFIIFDAYGDGICCGFGNGSYELTTDDDTVIFSGGEFGSDETTNMATQSLSVDEYTLNSIRIYPNPTTSELNIKLSNTNDLPNGYKIYNMLGQLVTEKTIDSNLDLIINTSAMSNGMYFIKIAKGNSALTLPFVKE
ncbi:M43 family zinc metalloprotease [Hanstruepera marina]|uniref:M43 family zinc metalloprotease n=1 Tax=Hanstruepera marina TaxID=2873265 RepID=UPI001CA799A3|nr:M43 family zinc metalloprotease [Hanstruepera marina]